MKHYKRIKVPLILFLIVLVFYGCQSKEKEELKNYTQSDIAMGTIVTANIYTTGEDMASEIFDLLRQIEISYISWREEDSEIARLNESAGNGKGVEVTGKLEEMLKSTLDISQKSNGALDPTIGKISRLWDIDGENPRVPAQEEIDALLQPQGYENVICNEQNVILQENTSIDLGAVGKGIGCDEVKDFLLTQKEIQGAVISVGGSILTYGTKENGAPWAVAITDPKAGGENYMGVLSLEGENYISTSGDYEKYFEQDGIRYHHILDPKTGSPSRSGLISVTVAASNGLLSDGLSTACFVLGLEEGMKLAEQYDAEAVFIDENRKVYITDGLKEKFQLIAEDTYQLQ